MLQKVAARLLQVAAAELEFSLFGIFSDDSLVKGCTTQEVFCCEKH